MAWLVDCAVSAMGCKAFPIFPISAMMSTATRPKPRSTTMSPVSKFRYRRRRPPPPFVSTASSTTIPTAMPPHSKMVEFGVPATSVSSLNQLVLAGAVVVAVVVVELPPNSDSSADRGDESALGGTLPTAVEVDTVGLDVSREFTAGAAIEVISDPRSTVGTLSVGSSAVVSMSLVMDVSSVSRPVMSGALSSSPRPEKFDGAAVEAVVRRVAPPAMASGCSCPNA